MAASSFTASDGNRIAYHVDDHTDPWKPAATLLLLHAAMGHSRRFYGWVPGLSRDYRVVRMDLRGHGDSAVPPETPALSMDRLVADVSELRDAGFVELLPASGYGLTAVGTELLENFLPLHRFAKRWSKLHAK